MATKSDSSRRWLKEHFSDPYVKQAHEAGFRSRAIFKIKEINERDRLFKPGMKIVDLGAAPGGWSEYVVKLIKPKGKLVAIDLLKMDAIEGVEFIHGDFTDENIWRELLTKFDGEKIDFVLSDMSPNLSGNESIDIPRSIYLTELALDFALNVLKPNGGILFKVFQGEGFDSLLGEIKGRFKKVAIRKPKASRGRSREVYILARELRA